MVKCDICQLNEGGLSAVIQGVYYKNVCTVCNSKGSHVSSGHARWARSVDAEDNEAAIQQPWQSDGSPNPQFIRLYPKQAAGVFTQDEMDRALRK